MSDTPDPSTNSHPDALAVDAIRSASPWTRSQNVKRMLWGLVQSTLFYYSLPNAYRWRATLLRTFGAKLAPNVRIRRTVRIEIPWHLTIGTQTAVGEFAILYCLGPITIGEYVTISQYAHLCAGTHETYNRQMKLLRPPITIGDDVWIAADAFVGPNVTIGDRTIVGARSNVFRSLRSDVIAVGNPAKPVKARDFQY